MKTIGFIFVFLAGFFFGHFQAQTCLTAAAKDLAGNTDVTVDCSYPLNNGCLPLTVEYPKIFETSSYLVAPVAYSPVVPYNSGTSLNANFDDEFSSSIPIPFNFCFFGNSYSNVVIGSNGLITFDLGQRGNVSYPNIRADNPSPLLPTNSVFGVLQDLVFSNNDDSEIYYSTIGTAPCTKFVINFYKGRLTGCTDTVSSQIVLHEGSNIVEVFVEDKKLPCPTAKFKESLIGVLNSSGTTGFSPLNRNTGIWAAQNEGWRFSPNGAEVVPQIQWRNTAGQNVGYSQNITVCPNQNEIYTASVLYNICGSIFELKDSIDVKFDPSYPLPRDYTQVFCTTAASLNVNLDDYQPNLTPNPASNFIFTYHLSQVDAETGNSPQPNSTTISGNQSYFVRIQSKTDASCFRIALLNMQLISNALLTSTVSVCDLNSDGVENNYRLSQLNSQLFSSGISGMISYFTSQTDATNNVNAVTTANITSTTQLWVRLVSGTCVNVYGPISVNFTAGPAISTPITFSDTMCDTKGDGMEPYSFTDIDKLITSDRSLTIKYFSSYSQAYDGFAEPLSTVTEGSYKIFARVDNGSGCFSIAEVNLTIIFTKIVANDKTAYVCFNGTDDKTFDLNVLSQGMLIDPVSGITITFYNGKEAAYGGEVPNQISPLQTITDDGNYVSRTYFVRFTGPGNCYTVKEITVALYHPTPAQSTFTVCDLNNDSTESVLLSQFSAAVIGGQSATVKFFGSQADASSNSNELSNIAVNGTVQVWTRLESHGCVEVYPITLTLSPVPVVTAEINKIRNNICDNNNDGTEIFDLTQLNSEIYSGTKPATIQFYQNYDPATGSFSGFIFSPDQFSVSGNSTVYAEVRFSGEACFSASKITISTNFLPGINLNQNAVLKICDFDFNLQESFDMTLATPQIFDQSVNSVQLANISITYHKNKFEAEAGVNPLSSTQVTMLSEETFWARFQDQFGCYSVAPILLKTYLPPKALNSSIVVCDDNLDGNFEVNLTAHQINMVSSISADNIFSFYLSQSDALAGANPIINPDNFTMNPFPPQLWVRVENIPGCMDVAQITFAQGTPLTLLNAGPFQILDVCDEGNDGAETINLTQFENQIENSGAVFSYFGTLDDLHTGANKIVNPASYPYQESVSGGKIFIKVEKSGFCPALAELSILLKKTPIFSLPDYFFCPYEGSVDIQPDFSALNLTDFEWKAPDGTVISTDSQLLNVSVAGMYQLKVTAANGCTYTETFEVKTYEVPIITELVPSGNSYTVIATGSQPIQYSIDGITWQSSNAFHNLPTGVITFYVKFEGSDCLGLTKHGIMFSLGNAITPNGDGINDEWKVEDLDVFEGKNSSLQIFDRYGKMVFTQENSLELKWNGKQNGRPLATDTYWYVLKLPDGRIFNSWILLKNRD